MSNAKRFETEAEAVTWMADTFSGWLASLTADERAAILGYKDIGEQINEALRRDVPLSDDGEQLVSLVDLALSRFWLPEPIIVWRGTGLSRLRTVPVGGEVIDLAFTSTSLLREVAERFPEDKPVSEQTLIEILLPGGVRVGTFAGALDLVWQSGEVELLLPRVTRFRVVRQSTPIGMEVVIRE